MDLRNSAFVFAAMLVAGCAAPVADQVGNAAATRCTRELPTGSNIPVTRCRSVEDAEREAEAARNGAADAIARGSSGIRGPRTQ